MLTNCVVILMTISANVCQSKPAFQEIHVTSLESLATISLILEKKKPHQNAFWKLRSNGSQIYSAYGEACPRPVLKDQQKAYDSIKRCQDFKRFPDYGNYWGKCLTLGLIKYFRCTVFDGPG